MTFFSSYPPGGSKFCISFGIEDALIKGIRAVATEVGDVDPDQYDEVILSAFSLVYPKTEVKKHLSDILLLTREHLERLANEVGSNRPEPKHNGRSIGSAVIEAFRDKDASQICLYLADFDPKKAHEMYWVYDRFWVLEALEVKVEMALVGVISNMEACLYGFGGHYSSDSRSSQSGTTYDMTKGEGLDAARSLGLLLN